MRFSQAIFNKLCQQRFFHGTSDSLQIGDEILPFNQTNTIQEVGRKKNLDKVFFTTDIGSANIYAGRASNVFGGNPVIYEVQPYGNIETINASAGTTVYMSDGAKVIRKITQEQ